MFIMAIFMIPTLKSFNLSGHKVTYNNSKMSDFKISKKLQESYLRPDPIHSHFLLWVLLQEGLHGRVNQFVPIFVSDPMSNKHCALEYEYK